MSSSSREAKKELRWQMKEKLSGLPEQAVMAQSRIAQDLVLASPQYKSATRIGIYLSMPHGEAQTDSLVVDAVFYGKKVFVPYIYSVGVEKPKRKVMDMMHIESLEEYGELERDSWGIPKLKREGIENRENAMGWRGLSFRPDGEMAERSGNADAEGGLDLIVVPAVAFDKDLNRMGHGAGFYDKYLTQHFGDAQRQRPYLLGLCLAEQIVPEGKLVMEPWDWRVDAVAVGDGTMRMQSYLLMPRFPLSAGSSPFSLPSNSRLFILLARTSRDSFDSVRV